MALTLYYSNTKPLYLYIFRNEKIIHRVKAVIAQPNIKTLLNNLSSISQMQIFWHFLNNI